MKAPKVPQRRKSPRTFSIPIRLSQAEINLIEKAAHLVGDNRGAFVRAAAKEKALEILQSAELQLVADTSGATKSE
jgi:uncharacterized protein (DUF1778 family)